MTKFALPRTWDRVGLAAVGFAGFTPLVGLDPKVVPTGHGIYVVLVPNQPTERTFLADNPVKRPRIKAYSIAELEARWVEGTPVVYIGKAMGAEGLRDRLKPYARRSSGHSGGRAIWQLEPSEDLLVAWTETPGLAASEVETAYLLAFQRAFGRVPFANVKTR